VAPSRMVGVSASVNLPLHHKVQKFSSGTGSPGWSRKKGRKWLWCGGGNTWDQWTCLPSKCNHQEKYTYHHQHLPNNWKLEVNVLWLHVFVVIPSVENFQDQWNSRIFPGGIKNSRRFPVFPGVVDTQLSHRNNDWVTEALYSNHHSNWHIPRWFYHRQQVCRQRPQVHLQLRVICTPPETTIHRWQNSQVTIVKLRFKLAIQ